MKNKITNFNIRYFIIYLSKKYFIFYLFFFFPFPFFSFQNAIYTKINSFGNVL